MIVRELRFSGFRNLQAGCWKPSPGVNILYGDNGQGKTNLLEACWLFTGSRSFRGAKDAEMLQFGAKEAKISLDFFAGGREQTAEITIRQRRQASLNGLKLSSAAKLSGVLCGVAFSPAHLSLVKEGPEGRRRFVDSAYCQLQPSYVGKLAELQKVLIQRNAFLRQMRESRAYDPESRSLLELWNQTMAVAGARVTLARQAYIQQLEPLAAEIYAGLSGGREKLKIFWYSPAYEQGSTAAQVAAVWMQLLKQAQAADGAAGFSTVGPHREDMHITLNDRPVRIYGSQGQQRSAVLALKIAEAMLLQRVSGEPPVAFLDDVMSELDLSRQNYILHHIEGWQVFITCCEPSASLKDMGGHIFNIKQGVLFE